MICEYCGSEFYGSKFNPGTCAQCGAPKPARKEVRLPDMYMGSPVIDFTCDTSTPICGIPPFLRNVVS